MVSAFATTDATFEIDGTKKMFPTGSFIVNTDPAANITVHNIHDWDADENALAEVRWNEDSTRWECVDVDCTA